MDAVLSIHDWDYSIGSVFKQGDALVYDYIPDSDYAIMKDAIEANWPDQVRFCISHTHTH